MVQAWNVSKKYGETTALDDLSFRVDEQEIFGLIGPDGAGKTSLFRILTTLLTADGGRATVAGLDVVGDYRAIRSRIGYMPGRFSLYQDLTVEENLSFFATVFQTTIEENYHLIRDIYRQIEPFRTRRAGDLSGGMKQKLALSCALIHKPEVLFLDEPTTGVDPVSRKEFWEMLAKLRDQGITILVSTPYMDEAARCDRIALMQNGRFISVDSPEAIVAAHPHPLWAVRSGSMSGLLSDIRKISGIRSCFAFGDYHHVSPEQGTIPLDAFRRILEAKGHTDLEISVIRPGIEDCFMDLVLEGKNA
jgi:ABC-type multidrug transport system ATPase subunit